MAKKNSSSIGLALGAGGSKGFAHIGVIEALEEAGVKIDCIAGSSMGALIGALYAKDLDIKQVKAIFIDSSTSTLVRGFLNLATTGGLVKPGRIEEFIKKQLGNIKFEDLQIPLAMVATDINTGEAVIIRSGSVVKGVMASIVAPPIMQPIKIGGRILTDGGLSNPLPVDVTRELGAERVVAVNLTNGYFKKKVSLRNRVADMAQRAVALSQVRLAGLMGADADVTISPKIDNQIILGFENLFNDKIIRAYTRAGKVAAQDMMSKVRRL